MPPVKKPKRVRTATYIRTWREFRGLSQERAAERIGISRENYSRIENGKVPYNQDFLEVCAVAFSCRPSDLLETDPFTEKAIDKLRAILAKATPEEQNQILAVAKTLLENKS